MGGTIDGGKLAAKTNKEKHGEDFYANIGSKGGKAKVPKGFALMPKWKVRAAGVLGGVRSRRKPVDEGGEYV